MRQLNSSEEANWSGAALFVIKYANFYQKPVSSTVKPVLVVTSIKQPTCIKQPEESCPKIHRLTYLNCIKQPPAFSSHILSFPWVAAQDRFDCNLIGWKLEVGMTS